MAANVNMDDYDSDGDVLDVINFIEFGIPRTLYVRSHYFLTMDEVKFRKRFRLTKDTVMNILGQIEHNLEFPYDI
jgi:hypothetical protein